MKFLLFLILGLTTAHQVQGSCLLKTFIRRRTSARGSHVITCKLVAYADVVDDDQVSDTFNFKVNVNNKMRVNFAKSS